MAHPPTAPHAVLDSAINHVATLDGAENRQGGSGFKVWHEARIGKDSRQGARFTLVGLKR